VSVMKGQLLTEAYSPIKDRTAFSRGPSRCWPFGVDAGAEVTGAVEPSRSAASLFPRSDFGHSLLVLYSSS
jgi:hypothetical protein